MTESPRFKVYNADGMYIAACRHIEDAAAVVALHGDGATIRDGHPRTRTVWLEGRDGKAGDSFDVVGEVAYERMNYRNFSTFIAPIEGTP